MKDFTQGNILKQLIQFSVPMLLANLLQAAYSIIDAIWVGRLIGYEAFAAVSATMPLIFFLISAIIGVTLSTNILIGQAYGAKNISYLKKVLSNSFVSTLLICILISVLSIIFTRPLLHILNTPENLKPYAHTFFVISVAGLVFTFGYNWFGAVFRGLGDSKTPLILLVYSTLLNIIFVPILILGLGPIPKLGIAGAALGTVISSFLILLAAYFFILRKHPVLNVHNWDFTPDFEIVKKIFSIGIPISFQMVIMSLSGIFIISLVNGFGPHVMAAYGIGMRLDQLSFLPAMAIGMSVSSMVAQNLGAKKHERVAEILNLSLIISVVFSLFFFVIIYGFPKTVASIFTKEQSVIAFTVEYIKIVSFTYFTFAVMFVLQGVVRGAGDTMVMLVMTFIAIIVVRYPLSLWLSKTALKENGIWFGILASTMIGLIMNYFYYKSGRWKKMTVLPKMTPEEILDQEIEENIV
jgi:putative MATE family efflux protein